MARSKQVRWECPNGLHPGKLASSRPRRNATARFCLPCSETAGVLVERVAPAIERKRSSKAATAAARAQAKREAEAEARRTRHHVTVIDAAGAEFVLDAGELLREAWKSKTLRDEQEAAFGRWVPRPVAVPELVIRRGQGRAPAREKPLPDGCLPIRERDTMSGHAKGSGEKIVLTCGPRLGFEWLRAIVVHEAAHAAAPADADHGSRWKRAYVRAVRELYPEVELPAMVELDRLKNWELDEHVALAIHNARER